MSIASADVPRMGILAAVSALLSFSGVWPPYCTMQPSTVPFVLLAANQRDDRLPSVSGSKYSRSEVS